MSIVELERSLVTLFAEALGLEVDHTIFRGALPPEISDAAAVIVGAAATPNTPSATVYSVQLLGRFRDRDAALALAQAASSIAPYYNGPLTILKAGSAAVYRTRHSGHDVTGLSANFTVRHRSAT
jgi:hypothetical protein